MIPSFTIPFELTKGIAGFDIKVVSGSSFDIIVNVTRNEAVEDITGTTWTLKYSDRASTWSDTVAGSVTDAANGEVTFSIRADITATGNWVAAINAVSGGNTVYQIIGRLTVQKQVSGGAVAPTGTVFDWSAYDSFLATATDGPVRAGTGITAATNADGSLTFSVSGGGSGGHTIQEEGVSLTQRTNLNFIGSAITAADDAGNDATTITVDVSDKQPLDAQLTSLAALVPGAENRMITSDGLGGFQMAGTTTVRNNLGLGTADDVVFSTITADGPNLSNLDASQLSSGTVPDARFPATLPAASGVNLTALNASNLASGTVPTARLPAAALSLPEIQISPNDFDGPNATGSVDDCGFVPGGLDDATYHIHGIGVDTSSATQQSRDYIAVVDVPSTWTAYATTECFRFVVWAESSTSTDCKYDLEISRTTSIGTSETTIYTASNQTFTSSGVPQEISIDRASLIDTTVADRLVIRFRLYCRNNLASYIAGGVCRGE